MTIDRDQKSGLFIISYNVNKPGQAGGLNLRLDLTVYTPSRHITGRATITHATLQPLVFEHPIQGRYEEQGRDIELHLIGAPRLHEQHAQNQAHAAGHALLEQFFFDGQLKDGWQAGNGSRRATPSSRTSNGTSSWVRKCAWRRRSIARSRR